MARLSTLLAAVLVLTAWTPSPPQVNEVTIENGTGMAVLFLHIAGCGESEGNDWDDMSSWAYDHLSDGGFILPGDSFTVELYDGCYIVQPTYDEGTALRERVEVEGDTRVVLTVG